MQNKKTFSGSLKGRAKVNVMSYVTPRSAETRAIAYDTLHGAECVHAAAPRPRLCLVLEICHHTASAGIEHTLL